MFSLVFVHFVYGSLAYANEDKNKLHEEFSSPGVNAFMEGLFELAACDFLSFVFWLARMNEHTIPALEELVAQNPGKSVAYFR